MQKQDFLNHAVEHIDIKETNVVPLVEAMGKTAFSARTLARAASIYDMMIRDEGAGIVLTLAGSIISAGQKLVVLDLVRNNMIDAIVATGANIVDQDFFEGLGYKHYQGDTAADDNTLRELAIDRIYGAYSSREFIIEMGRYLVQNDLGKNSIVRECFERDVPIFVPAFSDCSAGFGLVFHQTHNPGAHVSIDSVKDFRELTQVKIAQGTTGIFMVGGGVPKNFVQDIVVSAEFLGFDAAMHRYAVQLTVADERDGALSGSTLKEANSWGKVDLAYEQMVYGEATVTLPLIAGYAYHKRGWERRGARGYNKLFEAKVVGV